MNNKILSLQKMSATGSSSSSKESNLSLICDDGNGSSISLHICTIIDKY